MAKFQHFFGMGLVALLILSCQSQFKINSLVAEEIMIEIKETTVGYIDDLEVGVGNIWEREYSLPDGSTKTGLTAQLFMDESWLFVGKGSVVDIKGTKWEVIEVEKQGKLGFVRLKPVN
jgi:hypothetical protein